MSKLAVQKLVEYSNSFFFPSVCSVEKPSILVILFSFALVCMIGHLHSFYQLKFHQSISNCKTKMFHVATHVFLDVFEK